MVNAGTGRETAGEAGRAKVLERLLRRTWTPRVLRPGPGALFELRYPEGILGGEYTAPVLVAAAKGLGQKLEVAYRTGVADTVGADLVASCVNDLVARGAEPLFFLDTITMGRKDPDRSDLILKGIADACKIAGCSLLGGETVEVPGVFTQGRYDLAGFAVGVVERSRLALGERLAAGDEVICLASTGLHTGGFATVPRLLLESRRFRLGDRLPGLRRTLGEELLVPTRIYARQVLALLRGYRRKRVVREIVHVGGGLAGALAPLLPRGLDAVLEQKDWPVLPIFRVIQEAGKIPEERMAEEFNLGIGMALVVSAHFTDSVLRRLSEMR